MASSVPPPPPPGMPAYGGGVPQPPPPSNLVWGILTTLFCCLPFGIVSIVYAARVNSLWTTGQYDAAVDSSKKARTWAIAAGATGAVVIVLYLLLAALGLMASTTTTTN